MANTKRKPRLASEVVIRDGLCIPATPPDSKQQKILPEYSFLNRGDPIGSRTHIVIVTMLECRCRMRTT